MNDKTPRVYSCFRWLLPLCSLLLVLMVGCSGSRAGRDLQGQESRRDHPPFAKAPATQKADTGSTGSSAQSGTTETDTGTDTKPTTAAQKLNNWKAAVGAPVSDTLDESSDEVDDSDYEAAPEDFWAAIQQAEEYYTLGCIANRDGSWEEAQYYFEKSLKTLAEVDVASDSSLTPEAVKYNTLLDNVISDYRVTLRSLGRLDEDAAPSAIVERFGDLEEKLDSMVVTSGEVPAVMYDLPIVMNDRVKKSIVYFQTVANQAFTRYLTRSKKYVSLFKQVLSEYGLPQDLVYLCLVESGYNPHAYSWARAMGLWQFIASTGQLYGLERNWWVDERKDPVKATHAAARFLKDLYDKFGSWDLAMAAYNGGPGRVERTCASQKTTDFWKLRLRRQTMDYVPLIYAATVIAKEPEKYGFVNISYEPEMNWDEVQIDKALDLNVVAQSVGCTFEELKDLNPELLRNITPPNTKGYTLKIPAGMRERFLAAYDDMPQAKTSQFARHKVKRKETLARIANRYGVSQYAILEANNLPKGSRLKPGMSLIVPIPTDRGYGMKNADNSGNKATSKPIAPTGAVYTVRSGDTMWDIAKAYGITTDELRRVNFLGANSHLKVGQKLKIPSYAGKGTKKLSSSEVSAIDTPAKALTSPAIIADASKPTTSPTSKLASKSSKKASNPKVYIVKSGDSISELAARFAMTPSQLRSMNKMGKSSRIFVGQKLRVDGGSNVTDYVVYQVRRGDTLGRIAQRYKTTISKIMAENDNIDPVELQVGDQIKIAVD